MMESGATTRESTNADHDEIRRVIRDAFGEAEGPVVADLAIALLADPSARPLLSLVAEHGDEIVGHVLFTAVTLAGYDAPIHIMAPLAVAGSRHRQGIGTLLIQTGLQHLREHGTRLVLVYGDPQYYSRTGFRPDHHIIAPYKLQYPEGWLAQELSAGAAEHARGTVQCADALNSPEYW